MARYDTIIIGAGHNGLVCAAYLARQGQAVLLVEASDVVGGLAACHEFHPGFRASVAHSVSHFPAKIVTDLDLESHGLRKSSGPRRTVGLSPQGRHVTLRGDTVSGVQADDIDAFGKFNRMMRQFAATLEPFWLKTMPRASAGDLVGLMAFARIGMKMRMMGRESLREFMRIAALPARDLVDEFFEDETLKATLCWDGIIGSKMAPRSPNHAVLPMLYRLAGEFCSEPANLIEALRACATASGVTLRTGQAVQRIQVGGDERGLAVQGVQLADGECVEAERVVSSADPQTTFLRLAGVENLEIGFSNRIRRLRCQGYVAKLHLALDGLPEFTGLDAPSGRLLIAPDMDAIEFAFDDAKYGKYAQNPVMEITLPSLRDATLAPDGQHVLSAHVMYVPYRHGDGWSDAARASLLQTSVETLARYAPGIRKQIVHGEILTPLDLEQRYHVSGGHWHHTEFALDQALMMRPTYQAAQYHTPISGLYLCGAGCHPGGDLTGAPGHNAAHAVLREKRQ